MMQTPIQREHVEAAIAMIPLPAIARANPSEVACLVNAIEGLSGTKFVHLEEGVPGAIPTTIGIAAEIEALESGVAQHYPPVEGLPELKTEVSAFIRNYLGVDVSPKGCIPTVGAMQGSMAAFLLTNRCHRHKDTILLIDPGFPVQKQQLRMLGMKYRSFDMYRYRGSKLKAILDEMLGPGDVSTIAFSNPTSPSWLCLTEQELSIIGSEASRADVIVLEDMAYLGMGSRKGSPTPSQPPLQHSIANYTHNWIMLLSGSKAFGYAGQRVGCMVVSNDLWTSEFPNLLQYFATSQFGYAMAHGGVYSLSSGVCQSAQYGFAAILRSANNGDFPNFQAPKDHEMLANHIKRIFTACGFDLLPCHHDCTPNSEGIHFTVTYPGFTGAELHKELLYYGISTLALHNSGCENGSGVKVCTHKMHEFEIPLLEQRLALFYQQHPPILL